MSEELDQVFVGLVNQSWKHYNEELQNTRMDDLLVGAVIASTVEQGYALIDLNSDGTNHYLRFEWLQTRQRLIFQLQNLSEQLVTAKVLGRRARVTIGYGEHVQNTGAVWSALKAEMKSGFLDATEPGVITCDADLTASYIYVQVPLILDLDQYFSDDWKVNYQVLQNHIYATTQALAKYLRGRLSA
jgi:hypothetical protein